MKIHRLKTHTRFYDRMFGGYTYQDKGGMTSQIRNNDRAFEPGDYVILERSSYQNQAEMVCRITDVLTDTDLPEGLQAGYAMISLDQVTSDVAQLIKQIEIVQMDTPQEIG